jgi:hypothetical protein
MLQFHTMGFNLREAGVSDCPAVEQINKGREPVETRGVIKTFEEADAMFQHPPHDKSVTIWQSTGRKPLGPTTFSQSQDRFSGMTHFNPEWLPYVRKMNSLLYGVFAETYRNQVIEAYQSDPLKDISRFDRAVNSGVERSLAVFAELHPEYLPVLKFELADSGFGSDGFIIAIAAARYSIVEYYDSGDINKRTNISFPKRSNANGYTVERSKFIGPTRTDKRPDEAIECLGMGIAQAVFEGAIEAHEQLSPKRFFSRKRKLLSMEPDPKETVEEAEKLRVLVTGLYRREKQRIAAREAA